jgi:hypothetical protein
MVDSALPNNKTINELEKELKVLLSKKKEANFQLKKILRDERKFNK